MPLRSSRLTRAWSRRRRRRAAAHAQAVRRTNFPMSDGNRQLTDHERRLVRWMLQHGGPEALEFLTQLELAEVTPWRCPCGCASINFQIRGKLAPPPGVHPIADFVFGEEETLGSFGYNLILMVLVKNEWVRRMLIIRRRRY